MRTKRWSIGLIVTVLLVGWGSYALGNTAVTVNPAAIDWTSIDQEISIGYRFFIDKTITITHLGLFDSVNGELPGEHNGPGLQGTHTVAIWRLPKTGGFDLKAQVTIGPGAELSDHYAWVALAEPLTITPDPEPGPTGFYERWMAGVWTPNYLVPGLLGDALIFTPQSAVTFDIVQAGIMRFEVYTLKDPAYEFAPPWPGVSSADHYAVNFKYSVPGPTAEAGDPCDIYTSQQSRTTIKGSATHTVPNTPMTYQWLEGDAVLQGSTAVVDGAATLDLAPLAALSIGSHTLKLEVTDGTYTSSDTMVLTVANTPPEGQPAPTSQVVEINADAIIITAEVADFDGDTVAYQWVKGGEVLASGTVNPPAGGGVVAVPELTIPAGDPRFPLGMNYVELVVNDGKNPDVSVSVTVEVKDTTEPTLAPTPSIALLWPPNHQLVPVTIWANGEDNGGGVVVLTASVQCSEDDGGTEPDWYIDSIDDTAGTIALRLRAERSGGGNGRVYTVTITATDGSGNQSTATVDIRVPHDKRKK